MKVGDRVKATRNNVYSPHYDGQEGVITGIDDNGDGYPYKVEFEPGFSLWCDAEPLTPERKFQVGDDVCGYGAFSDCGERYEGKQGIYAYNTSEDKYPYAIRFDDGKVYFYAQIKKGDKTMDKPTYRTATHEYTALKSISPESVLKGKPCKEEFRNYLDNFDFYEEPDWECLVERFKEYKAWLPWLQSHGYVWVKEIKKDIRVEMGNKFTINDTTYVYGRVDKRTALISTANGNQWAKSLDFEQNSILTSIESFKELLGMRADKWEEIYNTKRS